MLDLCILRTKTESVKPCIFLSILLMLKLSSPRNHLSNLLSYLGSSWNGEFGAMRKKGLSLNAMKAINNMLNYLSKKQVQYTPPNVALRCE